MTLTVSQLSVGTGVTFTWSSSLGLTAGNVGQVIRVMGGIATITSVTATNVAVCTITQAITSSGPYTQQNWTYWIPTASYQGGEHLAGETVTGLADGTVITPFVMPTNGFFTLPAPATKVTVGKAFSPQLRTLGLDLGQPTVQGKRKKIIGVSVRCQDTLGLSLGKSLSSVVPMKDLVVGNVGSQTDEVVTNQMVTGDAWTVIDQKWDLAGN